MLSKFAKMRLDIFRLRTWGLRIQNDCESKSRIIILLLRELKTLQARVVVIEKESTEYKKQLAGKTEAGLVGLVGWIEKGI